MQYDRLFLYSDVPCETVRTFAGVVRPRVRGPRFRGSLAGHAFVPVLLLLAIALACLSACGGSGGTGTATLPDTPPPADALFYQDAIVGTTDITFSDALSGVSLLVPQGTMVPGSFVGLVVRQKPVTWMTDARFENSPVDVEVLIDPESIIDGASIDLGLPTGELIPQAVDPENPDFLDACVVAGLNAQTIVPIDADLAPESALPLLGGRFLAKIKRIALITLIAVSPITVLSTHVVRRGIPLVVKAVKFIVRRIIARFSDPTGSLLAYEASSHSFAPLQLSAPTEGDPQHVAIVVHGFNDTVNGMLETARTLALATRPGGSRVFSQVLGFNYDYLSDIRGSGGVLRERLQQYGIPSSSYPNPTIVCHSLGGLVGRWAIEGGGPTNHLGDNATIITFGSPHAGLPSIVLHTLLMSSFGPLVGILTPSLTQVASGSGFLRELAALPARVNTRYYTVAGIRWREWRWPLGDLIRNHYLGFPNDGLILKSSAQSDTLAVKGLWSGETYTYDVNHSDLMGDFAYLDSALLSILGASFDGVPIPAGTFSMGSTQGQTGEQPVHTVSITRPFWMSKYEVTQEHYRNMGRGSPSTFQGPSLPVETVSWNEAMAYCAALTEQETRALRVPAGYEYRLPTEAEWEYCCRAGTVTEFNLGNSLSCLLANVSSCVGQTSNVGTHSSNEWGLHDMHGNVWELCLDGLASYTAAPVADPYSAGSADRIIRGGSWPNDIFLCRSAFRNATLPGARDRSVGFRVVLAPALGP